MELESLIEEIADTDSDLFEIGGADFLEAKCLVGCYTSVVVPQNYGILWTNQGLIYQKENVQGG